MPKPKLLLRVLLGLSLGLGAVEGAAWVMDGGGFPHLNRFVPDPELGVRLEPSSETAITWQGETTQVRINPQGHRGPDWGASQEGEILVVGDSQVFGLGVEESETHAGVLEELTGRPVLNGGVVTYGPLEYRAVVAEQLAARDGIRDVVVVYNFSNDLFELGNPNTERHVAWDGWAVRKETAPESSLQFPGRRWLMGQSHAVYHLRRLLHPEPTSDLAAPSEGGFDEVLAAREQAQEQALEAETLSVEQTRAYRSAANTMASTDELLAELAQQILDPDGDPLGELEQQAGSDAERVRDIVWPRYMEMARSPKETAALLLTSSRERQEAEQKLEAWAEGREGWQADRVRDILERRRVARQTLAETSEVRGSQVPQSAFWSELVALRALCQEHGATLTVVALPLDVQVDPAEWDKYGMERQDLSETEALLSALEEDAATLGIRSLNVLETLRQAEPGAFLDADLHMSPKGHHAVAVALDAALASPAPMALPAPGLPPERSRVPTWDELRVLPENTVTGSSRNRCVTHQLREWLSVRCFVPLFTASDNRISESRWRRSSVGDYGAWDEASPPWTPQGLSVIEAPLETYTLARPGETTQLLMPLFPGREAQVDFHWSNRTERLVVRWEGDEPSFAFEDRRRASEPAIQEPARSSRREPYIEGRCAEMSADLKRCEIGARTHLPECPPGEVNAGSGGQCFALCDAAHPCETGACLPWQGAEVCQ